MINPPPPPFVSNIAFRGLNFADADFDYYGYQEGFSVSATSPGMPRDAAIVLSRASQVELSNCSFAQLGGGGVHVTNGSTDVLVTASQFAHLGQSGVMVLRIERKYGVRVVVYLLHILQFV
eukprot:m.561114 g.561114  ORF g.561114 m.561114 type:complete len:121 (+) comp22212_c3_seq4:421-783(+)